MIKFVIMDRSHQDRDKAETLIRNVYQREYGAQVPEIADTIMALIGMDGAVLSAAGVRTNGDFFSEVYLDANIEEVISKYWSAPVKRSDIAEVTTMASIHPKASLRLMAEIVRHLRAMGASWAFFTITERLRALLKRMGVSTLELALADPAKLTDGAQNWGSYYTHNPHVVAIHDTMSGSFSDPTTLMQARQQEIA
ncbi:MAG: thermostable hemolysin [Rhodospirillaceae bacterium]|nr:thermostable hemolysin [Rhodospirillaceae bacterium]